MPTHPDVHSDEMVFAYLCQEMSHLRRENMSLRGEMQTLHAGLESLRSELSERDEQFSLVNRVRQRRRIGGTLVIEFPRNISGEAVAKFHGADGMQALSIPIKNGHRDVEVHGQTFMACPKTTLKVWSKVRKVILKYSALKQEDVSVDANDESISICAKIYRDTKNEDAGVVGTRKLLMAYKLDFPPAFQLAKTKSIGEGLKMTLKVST